MRGLEAWVTTVVEEKDVTKALVLARSLRRSLTTKPLVVVESPTLESKNRGLLRKAFDQVVCLDHHSVNGWIGLKDYSKLYCLNLTLFRKCVYLAPDTLVMKNCDELFDLPNDFSAVVCASNDGSKIVDTSVFSFVPSTELFEQLITNGKLAFKGQAGQLDTYMKRWMLNQKNFGILDSKYNFQLSNKTVATSDFSIAKLQDEVSEKLLSSGLLHYDGIMESDAIKYWRNLYEHVEAEMLEKKTDSTMNIMPTSKLDANLDLLDSVAIVGIGCRHPGADGLSEFWDLLMNGLSGIRAVPLERWTKEHGCKASTAYESTLGGFLSSPLDQFDSKFFGISPKEMEFLDPQQRLLLEVTWEAIENAGIDPLSLRRTHTGVFVGAWTNDYKDLLAKAESDEFYRIYMGNSFGAAAARLSFFLGITGPCMATESGCSSAMQSVDLACKSLRNGETSVSLACGVNLLVRPFNKEMMPFVIAADGRCKTFDSEADGFGRAEGCGVLVLKRYADAVKDGDHIYALIRGSSCVQEGVSRSMGTPTKECEALAMNLALKDAGVHPKDVSFIEAHGTGTSLGDPLEISAIAEVYGCPDRDEPLIVGSVKTNIGHTESCSGITGIVKVVASLQNEMIPPHLNLNTLNPKINLDIIPARIPLDGPIPWPKNKNKPRLAGVSSFGITGTDGHLIVQEAPEITRSKSFFTDIQDRPMHIMKLSARSEEALESMLVQYYEFLGNQEISSFPNICYTANNGRASSFPHRAIVIAKDCQEACKILQAKKYSKNEAPEGTSEKICFLFTGQGSQYAGMSKQLYDTSPVFRMHFEKCHKILLEKFGLNMKGSIWGSNAGFELSRSLYSQTGIFCVEYCLLKLWESWGIKPDYVMGHSLGEFCAAVAADILSLEDALMLVAERSRLVESLPKGGMLVLKADKDCVDVTLKEFMVIAPEGFWLDYAAVNSKEQTVLAGLPENVQAFAQFCSLKKNFKVHVLDASHAFHSRLMDPILEKYGAIAESINKNKDIRNSSCKFISGVYGKLMDEGSSSLSSKYWIDHCREKVNFIGACQALVKENCKIFLEVGPQPILSALVVANTDSGRILTCVPSLRKNEENWKTILGSLSKLYLSGWSVNWKDFDKYYSRSVVPTLPTYPFQRKRFWFDTQNMKGSTSFYNNGDFLHPLLGNMIPNASGVKIFQNGLDIRKRAEWIKDHCVGKRILFPGAGYLEMCLAAGHCVTEGLNEAFCKPLGPLTIENLKIVAPLALDEKLVCQMQVVLHSSSSKAVGDGDNHDGMKVQVFRQHFEEGEAPKWTEHCFSYFTPSPVDFDEASFRKTYDLGKIKTMCQTQMGIRDIYHKLSEVGLNFGASFQSLTNIWVGEGGVLAEARAPQEEIESDYVVHPVVLDAMLQAAMVVQSNGEIKCLHVPISIKKFTWLQNEDIDNENGIVPKKYFIYSTTNNLEKDSTEIISVLFSANNERGNKIIAFMIGMEFAETTVQAIQSHLDSQKTDLPNFLHEVWKPHLGPNQGRLGIWDIFREDLLNIDNIHQLEEYETKTPNLIREGFHQKLCFGYVLNAFYELGWNPSVNESFSLDEFISELKISPQHKKLLRYNMTMLADEGILAFTGDYDFKIVKMPPNVTEVQEIIRDCKDVLGKFENSLNSLQIYVSCGSQLAAILQGKASALPILFPQDPTQPSAETFYTESYSYSGMDVSSVQHFKTLLKPHDPNNKGILRILEVGAGTGNFTRDILNLFRDHGVGIEYTFTDISPAFFINAAKKFEDFKDVIKYQVLNIEFDAKLQGFSPQYFDFVVGVDVFHATKSLADSISNARQLLRPSGLLCLIEGARPNHITCIFGLLEGYWRFVDTDIRQHHPLVSGETWKTLCLNDGFDFAAAIPCSLEYYTLVLAKASNDEQKIPRPITMSPEGKWLVFPTLDNESKYLINRLSLYRPVITIWRSVTYQESEDGTGFGINVNQKDHMTMLMQAVRAQSNNTSYIEGILYLWGLSAGTNTDQADIAQPFLNLCQAIVEMKQQYMPKFFMVTSGISMIGDHPSQNPAGSTLWGIAKSTANELNMKIKMIDICPATKENGPQGGMENADDIFYELWNDTSDLFIAYRERARYFARLMKSKVAEKALKLPQSDRFHLIFPQTKVIGDLKFGTLGKYSLKADEIEVQVKSCALNFRDVFAVLKPDKQFDSINVIGSDFAGIVTAVGDQVKKWSVGDAVFGCNLEDGALPSHVRIPEDAVVRKPEYWTFSEACGLPAVFATAYYSLVTVAKMKAGDTVLVHTASGGVGLSAIQICHQIGAKVIATAGSSRKRAYLKSIGVRHVFHSRNTKYEHDIMKITNGRGVDIVLNSLTGPGFKEASLNVCKQGARFVEMSKLSIWQPEEVKALRSDVDYTIVDLTSVSRDVWKMLFGALDEFLLKGTIKPIPYVRFDGVHVREALTYLQKAKHIGKIVCVMPEIKFQSGQYTFHTPLFNPESTYLITGGLGGIGFEVVKWMIESQGAKHIVIVSRSQPKERHLQVIKALRAQNKNIITKSVDVGDPTMCKNLMDYLNDPASKLPPLRGIMHCAGVLSDATLINQSWEKFLQTFRPKVKGAWNLHELTKDYNLEHFVMFSSMAALFGPPGQSNHAAGNGYLDALTCYRDSIGLPAITVNWGQWGQVGVAAGREVRGVVPFSPARGIASLETIMKSQTRQIAVVDLDYQILMKVHPQAKAYLQHLALHSAGADNSAYSSIKSEKFWEEIDSAKEEDKPTVIKRYMKVLLRQILKLDDEEPIDDIANFQDMGLDSLMMIELKNNLQTILGSRMTFPASAMSDCHNIELLSEKLIQQMNELSDDSEHGRVSSKAPQLATADMWKLVEEDSKLPSTIEFNSSTPAPKISMAKIFLLTGVTGNLGPYILKELLKRSQVQKVYCLMRKTKNSQQRVDKILRDVKLENQSNKVKLVLGDLVSPKFGLDDNEWKSLSTEVDAVIHCAVKSNHVEVYGKTPLRTVNVFGTLRVLEFCANQKTKHLFHSSSIVAVSSTDDDGCLSENWPSEGELEGVTDLAYPISKMICDRLVHQAVERGLPAKAFRFGGLIGNSESGRFKHHNNHMMLRFLCYMKLGAMPSVPVPSILLPVDFAAAASIKIFFSEEEGTTSDIYNISHPNPALEQEFPVLAAEFGYDVEVVEYNEFVNRFSSEGEDSLLYPFRELYENEERYNSIMSFPEAIRKWLESPDTFFSVRKVTKIIPDYTQSLRPTWEYVRRDLSFAKATGLFEKFRLTK